MNVLVSGVTGYIGGRLVPLLLDAGHRVRVLGRDDALGVMDVGSDPLTFRRMMLDYARVRGLPRVIIPVPVLAPGLAALWEGLVTPSPNCLAVPLVRGIVKPVIGDTRRALELFPEIEPLPYQEAVEHALDFWRVEEVDPPRLLRLRAEMKLPGRAWLQWETREEEGKTRLIQAALFAPTGFSGWTYWYGSYPVHRFIFQGMVNAIGRLAEDELTER